MSALKATQQSDRNFHFRPKQVLRPTTEKDLKDIFRPENRLPRPIRPVGANTSTTGCTAADGGTVIDLTGLTEILSIDREQVTVQAGVSLRQLADVLDENGLELPGYYDFCDRTIGGAVCGGCIGPSLPGDGALLSSQVLGLKMITPDGQTIELRQDDERHGRLLSMIRQSYGLLGVVYEITLRVRRARSFTVAYHKLRFDDLHELLADPAAAEFGTKMYVIPARNRVYLELRRHAEGTHAMRRLPWKLKDWLESAAAPALAQSIARAVPFRRVRYSLIDGFNDAVHALMNNAVGHEGSHALEQTGRFRTLGQHERFSFSTWCFKAEHFARVLSSYRIFCQAIYRESRFRCDMPAVAYRMAIDQRAVLSPSYNGPMYALSVCSTPSEQWKDFVLDFSDFAGGHAGVPLLHQSRGATVTQYEAAYGNRLTAFRKLRQKLDPDDRFANPFLLQYML
jgi:FAD/FMN-containing dehydrogenase